MSVNQWYLVALVLFVVMGVLKSLRPKGSVSDTKQPRSQCQDPSSSER